MTSDRAAKPANFLQNEVMPRRTRVQGSISGVQAESLWAMEPGQGGQMVFHFYTSFTGFSNTAPYGLALVGRAVL